MAQDALDDVVPLDLSGEDLRDDLTEEVNRALRFKRSSGARRKDGDSRVESGAQRRHGACADNAINVFIAIKVSRMTQAAIYGKRYEFAVAEEA